MKAQKGNANYDLENDVLYIRPNKREYGKSEQVGDFIFDTDSKGNLNGIEILNASKHLQVPKNFLLGKFSGKLQVIADKELIVMNLSIRTSVRNTEKESILNVERSCPESITSGGLVLAVA